MCPVKTCCWESDSLYANLPHVAMCAGRIQYAGCGSCIECLADITQWRRQAAAVEPKIGIKPEAQQPSLARPLWNDAKSAHDGLQKSVILMARLTPGFASLIKWLRYASKASTGTYIYFINWTKDIWSNIH